MREQIRNATLESEKTKTKAKTDYINETPRAGEYKHNPRSVQEGARDLQTQDCRNARKNLAGHF